MGYDQREKSSSSGAVVAVVVALLLLVILGGLLLVGVGAMFWVRTASAQQQAVVELRRAEAERARAVAEAASDRLHANAIAQIQRQSAETDASVSQPDLTVDISEDGSLSINGEQIDLAALQERLAKLRDQTGTAVSVAISVHPDCPAGILLPVQTACHEVGHATIRVETGESRPSGEAEVRK